MMAYEGNKVIERLDRLAAATIDANAENGAAPRLSILANLAFMAAGSAGLVLTAQGDTGPGLVFGALMMSTTHTPPRFPSLEVEPLRSVSSDRQLRAITSPCG